MRVPERGFRRAPGHVGRGFRHVPGHPAVTLDEFRTAVYAAFGSQLEHVTPELMRDFIARMYAQLSPPERTEKGAVVIPPDTIGAASYEEIVITFFARMLELPPDQALILLWLFAGEIYFSDLGEQYSERFKDLAPPEKIEPSP